MKNKQKTQTKPNKKKGKQTTNQYGNGYKSYGQFQGL